MQMATLATNCFDLYSSNPLSVFPPSCHLWYAPDNLHSRLSLQSMLASQTGDLTRLPLPAIVLTRFAFWRLGVRSGFANYLRFSMPDSPSSPSFSRVSSAIHCTRVDGLIKTASKPLPITALHADGYPNRPRESSFVL